MGRYQVAGTVPNDGAATPIAIPTPLMPGDANAITALQFGATVALADRIGATIDPGAAHVDLTPPPVPVPPGAVLAAARFLHSLSAGIRASFGIETIAAGAPGVGSFVHGLGAIPDFVAVMPTQSIIGNGSNWAATVIDDTQIDFANWDAGNAVDVNVYCALLHSIDTPLESAGPQIETIAGVAPQVWAHGLGRVPDFISVIPWAPGLVEPEGLPVLGDVPDLDQITVQGNFAGAAMDVLIYAQATHSIQE